MWLTVTLKKSVLALALLAMFGCEDALVRQQPPSTLTDPDPSIEAFDQVPEDAEGGTRNAIKISRATIGEQGWAVLYEGSCFDENGARVLTTILGQSELVDSTYDTAEEGAAPNLNEDTAIVASRALRPNEPLCVVVHADTGTQRQFEYEATSPFSFAGATNLDKPLLRDDEIVAATIFATVEPVLEVPDQGIDAGAITLGRVAINGPGWVSVVQGNCEDTGLDDEVVGHAFVSNGINEAVDLLLNTTPSEETEMCARLHRDDPADGVFSFGRIPGAEPPVTLTVAGEDDTITEVPVTASFTARP